ncbi:MAG: DUF4236 domain-containing protein [Proteobacteria bacterium]|nr:DUF4236 domain-containing protein [Pseudomonadota bacterium]
MGFRFRRPVNILPGVRINFGKRGISATVGPRGASVNIGPRGTHLNLGLPGTGLSYRTRLDTPPPQQRGRTGEIAPPDPAAAPIRDVPEIQPAVNPSSPTQVIEFKSVSVASLGSESFARVGALLDKLKRQRATLTNEIMQAEIEAANAKKVASTLAWLRRRIAPAAFAARQKYVEDCADRLDALKEIRDSLVIGVEFAISDDSKKCFLDVLTAFDRVSRSARIWDITSARAIDRPSTRSAANQAVDVRPVGFDRVHDDIMATEFKPPLFINANGADLLIYPAFVVAQVAGRFALLDIREVEITVALTGFLVEDGNIPSDTQVVANTWKYVNKNGQPDRRFSYNPTIPIAQYCKIFFRGAGLNEAWMVSNAQAGIAFGEALLRYKESLTGSVMEAEGIAPPSADEWPDVDLPEKVAPPPVDWRTSVAVAGCLCSIAAMAGIMTVVNSPQSLYPFPGLNREPATLAPPVKSATKAAPTPKATAVEPSLTEAEVAEMQQLLKKAGFDPGLADGKAGASTRQALLDWARSRQIQNPKLDRATLEALRRGVRDRAR